MFAILLYCKRFTAINYSLNLTFFYKFSAILLGCSLFFETRDLFGMDPDPNPTRTPNNCSVFTGAAGLASTPGSPGDTG